MIKSKSRSIPTHTMVFQSNSRTYFIAVALYCFLQSVEVGGHHTTPMQQPQFIPQYIPVPQYQQPQVIPIPQYVQQPQYIPVPMPPYMQQQPMYYPQPPRHHRPYFDCYRGIKLDEIISDMEKIEP